ncbi:MAG: beta strand repeat-containing protein, partial [Terrimicrobiaceae bacterium]
MDATISSLTINSTSGLSGNKTLTVTGTTSIENGNLTVSNGVALVSNGTISLAADFGNTATLNIGEFGGSSTAGIVSAAEIRGGNGTAILNFNQSNNITFTPKITGSTAVNQLGNATTTLTGNNTYTGGTTISAGTLQIGAGGTTGSIVGNVALSGGRSSNLAFNRSDTYTFGGNITGSGSVLQNGNGKTVLTGTSNYSGGTAVNAGTLEVSGTGNVTGGTLFIRNATYNLTNNGTASHNGIWLSDAAGQTAALNVTSGGNLTSASPIFIGHTGTGIMNVSGSGSKFTGSSTTFLGGPDLGGNGTLNVTDNATYSTSSNLFVGNNGQGLLNITSGGRVTSGIISVGTSGGSSGTITLNAGTLNGSQLNLGQNGSGNLTALNGSTVNATSSSTFIGNSAAGTALFDASNFNAGQLFVGNSATGSLTMRNGSVLTTNPGNAFIAAGGPAASVTISGNGSTWLHTGVVFIGNNGQGTLSVLDGGVVTSAGGNAFVGAGAGSTGVLLVDGAGSSYTISGTDDFSVGGRNSTVTVSNGGFLETKGRAFIAAGFGTSANATVTGTGSRWRSLDYFSVGQ